MTDIFVKSATCECEPGGQDKALAITEGHTTVWVCKHTDTYELKFKKEWELQNG